jgi:hypothetical protein
MGALHSGMNVGLIDKRGSVFYHFPERTNHPASWLKHQGAEGILEVSLEEKKMLEIQTDNSTGCGDYFYEF